MVGDTETLNAFFDELPDTDLPDTVAERSGSVSIDFRPAYAKSVCRRAPQVTVCSDPFHLLKPATDALDAVCRQAWQFAGMCVVRASPRGSKMPAGYC